MARAGGSCCEIRDSLLPEKLLLWVETAVGGFGLQEQSYAAAHVDTEAGYKQTSLSPVE